MERVLGLKPGRNLAVRARHRNILMMNGEWRKKSRRNEQGLMVYATFAAHPRATIDKFRLLGLSTN